MYIITILLICVIDCVVGPIAATNSFKESHIVLGILHIIITLLFLIVAIIAFIVRERCGDFELDVHPEEDDPTTQTLKNTSGYIFGFAIILVIIMWFCNLAGII